MKTLSVALLVVVVVLGPTYLSRAADINLGVEITEIMYDTPNNYDSGGEWIEIYNDTGSSLNINGWQVYDGVNWRTISQESGYGDITNIPVGSYAVICEEASSYDFVTLYDGDPFPVFPTSRYLGRLNGVVSLSNDGENIRLRDASQTVYQNFSYPDNATNASLVKVVIRNSEDESANWTQSTITSGSPGEAGDDQSLPVTLSSFAAIPTDSGVTLKWRTESEVGNIGFNIYRSEKKDGKFVKINDKLIPGAGNSAMPNSYQFVDKTAIKGREYYYYLEDVDVAGLRNKFSIISSKNAEKLAATWGRIKKGS